MSKTFTQIAVVFINNVQDILAHTMGVLNILQFLLIVLNVLEIPCFGGATINRIWSLGGYT